VRERWCLELRGTSTGAGRARLGFQAGEDALKGVATRGGYVEDERKRQQRRRTPNGLVAATAWIWKALWVTRVAVRTLRQPPEKSAQQSSTPWVAAECVG
jgi:hypothetical protein